MFSMQRLLEVKRLIEEGTYFNVDTKMVRRLFEARRLLEEI